MAYETIEDLKLIEAELADTDRLLDQESDQSVRGAIASTAVALGAGGAGIAGGGAALFFAGVTGFSAVGITSGLAAIGSIVGGGMLAGLGLLAAGPVLLAGGGFLIARHLKVKNFREARDKLRASAMTRRDFLRNLVDKNQDLGDRLAEYKVHLNRLTQMIEEMG